MNLACEPVLNLGMPRQIGKFYRILGILSKLYKILSLIWTGIGTGECGSGGEFVYSDRCLKRHRKWQPGGMYNETSLMPRLQDTPEEATFRARLRAWLAENAPVIHKHDVEALRAWQRRLYEGGWLGLTWPAEYGGQGLGFRKQAIYNEEAARAKTPPSVNNIGLMIVGPALIAVGSEEQKRRYLKPILTAEEIWCQGFSEPNAGSDLAGLQTRAEDDGDDYIVTGQKIWTSNSLIADHIWLLVRTDPEAPRHKGITALIVDMRSPGVSVKPLRQLTGEAEFGEVFFDEVRVPKANRVGAENDGWIVGMKTFTRERANISVSLSVRLQQQFDRLLDAVRGRDFPLDPQQSREIALAYVDSQCLTMTCERLADRLFGFDSAVIKVAWAEMNQRLQEIGISTLGPDAPLLPGGGFDQAGESSSTWGTEALSDTVESFERSWQFGYLRSRANSIEGGTSEILRTVIAERVLGLPRK